MGMLKSIKSDNDDIRDKCMWQKNRARRRPLQELRRCYCVVDKVKASQFAWQQPNFTRMPSARCIYKRIHDVMSLFFHLLRLLLLLFKMHTQREQTYKYMREATAEGNWLGMSHTRMNTTRTKREVNGFGERTNWKTRAKSVKRYQIIGGWMRAQKRWKT